MKTKNPNCNYINPKKETVAAEEEEERKKRDLWPRQKRAWYSKSSSNL